MQMSSKAGGCSCRVDEDLPQIMTPEELSEYRRLERHEDQLDAETYRTRKTMRRMRANARRRQKKK
jgi:hypothetical protein